MEGNNEENHNENDIIENNEKQKFNDRRSRERDRNLQQFRNNDGYRERSNHSDIGTCNQSNERTSRKNRQRDKKNWYRHDAENRLHRISEAGKKRNEDAKQFYESSQHYDNLKRAFYHVTDAAYIEGDISQKEKTEYLSKIHKNDRKSLEELLEIKRKGCKRSNNAK